MTAHLLGYYSAAAKLYEAKGEPQRAVDMMRRYIKLDGAIPGRDAQARLVALERHFATELATVTDEVRHLRTVELVERNDQLAALNRQKDEILNVVAHDLRNPLAAAQTLCEPLLMDADADADSLEQLKSIRAAASEMGATIDTLLHLQQHESPSVMTAVDEIVVRSLSSAEKLAGERNIDLTGDITPVDLRVDGALLRRSLDDVLWLCMQTIGPGKTIAVSVEANGEGGAQIVISCRCVPDKANDRALYIARRLVERMRGSITIFDLDGSDLDGTIGTIGTKAVIDLRGP